MWLTRNRLARLSAVALAVLVAGYLAANQRSLEQNQRRLDRQAEQLEQARDASCVVFAGIGTPSLLRPESGELARKIVSDSATAARIMGCAT